jgi:hypothetical protein
VFARWLAHIDRVLLATGRADRDWLAATVWGGIVYGAVMGTFGGFAGDRPLQIVYSAVKVPMLIAITTLLSLPTFFVMNTLAGLRADFAAAVRAVVATQGAVCVILAALAPLTAVWYASSADYHEAIAFNGVMFAAASLAGQWVLRRRYAPLVAANRRHRTMLRLWVGVYAFVGIQMGWVLRPFVGDVNAPTTFFRETAWGNAYVVVAETVWKAVR